MKNHFKYKYLLLAFMMLPSFVHAQTSTPIEIPVTGYRGEGASPSGSMGSVSFTDYQGSSSAGKAYAESMAAAVKAKECAKAKEQNAANEKTCESSVGDIHALAYGTCETKYSNDFDYRKCTNTADANLTAANKTCISLQAQADASIGACK